MGHCFYRLNRLEKARLVSPFCIVAMVFVSSIFNCVLCIVEKVHELLASSDGNSASINSASINHFQSTSKCFSMSNLNIDNFFIIDALSIEMLTLKVQVCCYLQTIFSAFWRSKWLNYVE